MTLVRTLALAAAALLCVGACKRVPTGSEATADASTAGPWRDVAAKSRHPEWTEATDQSLAPLRPDVRARVVSLLNEAAAQRADARGVTSASELLLRASMRDGGSPLTPDTTPDIALRNGELAVIGGLVAQACTTAKNDKDGDAALVSLLSTVRALRLVPRGGPATTRLDDSEREALLQEARLALGDDRFTTLMHRAGPMPR